MDQPKIPTLKDSQKPQLKIRGLGVGLTLVDRLKQFKKKDLAFILAGLGTLFMAPLAEHFMMSPESGDGQLQQGWGKGTGSNLFGGGGSPYESGNNGIAQGGAIGGGGDIITPLNVRDPSSLVLGPGSAQQPPAGSVAPSAPPTRSDADMKDALAGAASRAASSAAGRAPLPIPKASLGNSGLRGLGVAGGGSSSSSGALGPITGGAGGAGGTGGGGLNLIRSPPNYRGSAGARGGGNPTGLDATRKAGQNAGDAFSRNGSALSNLNEAAKETIPTGGGSYGGQGQGGFGSNDKGPGGSGPGGSKSVGESLAFIAAKERMMQDLQLNFEKRKLKDADLLLYGMRNDAVKLMGSKLSEAMAGTVVAWYKTLGGKDKSKIKCSGGTAPKETPVSRAKICKGPDSFACFVEDDGNYKWKEDPKGNVYTDCEVDDGEGNITPTKKPEDASSGSMRAPLGLSDSFVGSVDKLCTKIDETITSLTVADKDGSTAVASPGAADYYKGMRIQAGKLLLARNSLLGGSDDKGCGGNVSKDEAVEKIQDMINSTLLYKQYTQRNGTVPALTSMARALEGSNEAAAGTTDAAESLRGADKGIASVQQILNTSKGALDGITARFALAPGHNLEGDFKKVLGQATSLTSTLKAYQEKLQAQQEALLKAKNDLDPAAKEFSPQLLNLNTQLDKLVANKGLAPDKVTVTEKDDKAPVPAQAVREAIKNAGAALQRACGEQTSCSSLPPANETTVKPVANSPEAKAINDAAVAVLEMDRAQERYVNGVFVALNSLVPQAGAGANQQTAVSEATDSSGAGEQAGEAPAEQ